MENERAENVVLASSPQLAACPEKQTVAGRKWGGSAGNLLCQSCCSIFNKELSDLQMFSSGIQLTNRNLLLLL